MANRILPMAITSQLPSSKTNSLKPYSKTGDIRAYSLYEKLHMRLNTSEGNDFGFDHIHIISGPNLVFVFIVLNEKAIILEDPVGLFPSDKMVAQVRLMQDQI